MAKRSKESESDDDSRTPGVTPPARRHSRILLWIGLGIVVVALGGFIVARAFDPAWVLVPDHAFDPAKSPPAPDYARDEAWAALPDLEDPSDLSLEDAPAASAPDADVFFIHPTTYFSDASWNARFDDPTAAELVDQLVLSAQASAFNRCCAVYAPRYRQGTLGVFFVPADEAQPALALAYEDVERAFDAFLGRTGERPFLIAGHSQGSLHAMRLLERIDASPALRARFVAAYVPGYALPMARYQTRYEHVVPCDDPEQVRCVAAWDTYAEGAAVRARGPLPYWEGDVLARPSAAPEVQCTNPITWQAGTAASDPGAPPGAVAPITSEPLPGVLSLALHEDGELYGIRAIGLERVQSKPFSARCAEGALRVPDLSQVGHDVAVAERGNYHPYDVSLFYERIRDNAVARVEAWRNEAR